METPLALIGIIIYLKITSSVDQKICTFQNFSLLSSRCYSFLYFWNQLITDENTRLNVSHLNRGYICFIFRTFHLSLSRFLRIACFLSLMHEYMTFFNPVVSCVYISYVHLGSFSFYDGALNIFRELNLNFMKLILSSHLSAR